MKTITINGVTFEVISPRTQVCAIERDKWDGFNAIFECYGRPSIYKQEIWNEWFKWAVDTIGVRSFYISGHNSMQFSIAGLYEDGDDGNRYNLVITRARQNGKRVYVILKDLSAILETITM